ncbi:MAG: GNAT family N-acetyltransferase, partial [Schwartzia sp.]|nr:GNAT family N-acetyltransferase [Schwartzia sp. (in: firmicutes)]
MMQEWREMKIRSAIVDDAEQLLAIYAYYVEHTAISFEYDVPSVQEFRSRIENILKAYP